MRYSRFASASRIEASGRPEWRSPSTKSVGVVATPARTPAFQSAAMRSSHRLGAAVRVETRDVETETFGPLPQVRILEPSLVGEQRVVHLPEAPLQAGRLGGAGGGPGTRVAGADREVPERDPQRQLAQPQLERGAVRALEVGVDDHEARRLRPSHVIGGADGRERCRAEAAQAAWSASKIRLAPGRSPGESAS